MTDLIVAILRLCAALTLLGLGWRPLEELPGWLAHRATGPWRRLTAAVDPVLAAPLRRLRLRRVDGPAVVAAAIRVLGLLGLLALALRVGGAPDVFTAAAVHAWLQLPVLGVGLAVLVGAALVPRRWPDMGSGARLGLWVGAVAVLILLVGVPVLTAAPDLLVAAAMLYLAWLLVPAATAALPRALRAVRAAVPVVAGLLARRGGIRPPRRRPRAAAPEPPTAAVVAAAPPSPASVAAARPAPRRAAPVAARNRRRLARPRGRRRVAVTGAVLVLVGLVGLGSGAVAFNVLATAYGSIPDAHPMQSDSLVYDRTGRLVADVHPPGDTRIPVPLDAMSPWVAQATVAVEDRGFWTEGAESPTRMVVAAVHDVFHGDSQGASTITQQLAKIRYLDSSRSLDRKLRQIFIARKLAETMTKTQILEDYLNSVFYGHGATGIQAAAHVYFGVDASQLDLGQASMLAGLPNAPALLDPATNMPAVRDRQQAVLKAMLDTGAISRAQADAAAAEPLTLAAGDMDNLDMYPAFTARVVTEVHERLNVDAAQDGLRITTTLLPALQDLAQRTVTAQVGALSGLNVSDGAAVCIDPQSGDVLAWVGGAGPGHPGYQIDMASHPRQPGSTFKLFTYSTAFSTRSITMLDPIVDGPFSLPTGGGPAGLQPYRVTDYDGRYHGTVPIEQALGNSLNIPAVKVEMKVGVANVVHVARAMGVTTLDHPDSWYGASLTLGSYPVPLWQMAQAASALADQGVLHPAHTLLAVSDDRGHQLLGAQAPRPVLDAGVAAIMNRILTDDSNRVMEFGSHSALTLPDHVVAAKTGTTQDFRDNLTVGWTPHLVTAAWVGNTDDSPMHGTTGVTGAAPIWHDIMEQALRGVADDWPPPPADVHPISAGGRSGIALNGTSVAAGGLGGAPGQPGEPAGPGGGGRKHH